MRESSLATSPIPTPFVLIHYQRQPPVISVSRPYPLAKRSSVFVLDDLGFDFLGRSGGGESCHLFLNSSVFHLFLP